MNLNEALALIAAAGGLNADDLIRFADEDSIGGRDQGYWSAMGIHEAEGKVLYALVRALRPRQCVEIGVAEGCSSAHILAALNANDAGKLYSVDLEENVGGKVPQSLRDRWTLIAGQDALEAKLPKSAEFIWEDGPHTEPFTSAMYERLLTLSPRVLLSHDYHTHLVYPDFKTYEAWMNVIGVDQGVMIDGAFTGLAYWFPAEG